MDLQSPVGISSVGWCLECKDGVTSVEHERPLTRGRLVVDSGKRRLDLFADDLANVRIPLHTISLVTVDRHANPPRAYLSLLQPPSFEDYSHVSADPRQLDALRQALAEAVGGSSPPAVARKLSSLDADHARISPYLNDLLVTFTDSVQMDHFLDKADEARLDGSRLLFNPIPIARRDLYSQTNLDRLDIWYRRVDINLAMACAALVQNSLLDPVELLSLRQDIVRVVADPEMGTEGAEQCLRRVGDRCWKLYAWEDEDGDRQVPTPLKELLAEVAEEVAIEREGEARASLDRTEDDGDEPGVFKCFHLIHTPTAFYISPRQPERTNRIVRKYANHQGRFLRVNFRSEDHQQYRHDRDVGYAEFLMDRVGGALKHGIRVAGRQWEFLGYSGSALKDHSAWFFSPTYDKVGARLDANTIRDAMGDFEKETYYPARLGARQSQTFTSTDPSVILRPDQIWEMDDIERNGYCFTDGAGTMSFDLAHDIWAALQRKGRAGRTYRRNVPSAFQVRLGGLKGMLTVDHSIQGKEVRVRPSMNKFSSPNELEVEIAKSFTKPGLAFLNQPLIKILEELGVNPQVVLDLQRDAADWIKSAESDLGLAKSQLDIHGLGTAFKIPSVLGKLQEAGFSLETLTGRIGSRTGLLATALYDATIHVLRDLKSRARIPVPGSVTLVGVPDEWGLLREGEIYASLAWPGRKMITWVEGPVCISRSPTVHLGDVRMAYAIGKPPPEWINTVGRVQNAVVFSIEGERPLMHMLGGGDADGDEYVLLLNPDLHPPYEYTPASYVAAEKLELDRPATVSDVADHFVNFIASDVLGLISFQNLITSDFSVKGMRDPACFVLASLASLAVDFNKSGTPVPMRHLPRKQTTLKPYFLAPEGLNTADIGRGYYDSNHLLSKLWKAIELPPVLKPKTAARKAGKRKGQPGKKNRRRKKHATVHAIDATPATPLHTALLTNLSSLFPLPTIATAQFSPPPGWAQLAASRLCTHFCSDLSIIASVHSLEFSHRSGGSNDSRLSEAEVFIGTILSTTSDRRLRRKTISDMRERSTELVRTVTRGIRGAARAEAPAQEGGHEDEDEDDESGQWMELARRAEISWACWVESEERKEEGVYGAESFGWVAIGEILDVEEKIVALLDEELESGSEVDYE